VSWSIFIFKYCLLTDKSTALSCPLLKPGGFCVARSFPASKRKALTAVYPDRKSDPLCENLRIISVFEKQFQQTATGSGESGTCTVNYPDGAVFGLLRKRHAADGAIALRACNGRLGGAPSHDSSPALLSPTRGTPSTYLQTRPTLAQALTGGGPRTNLRHQVKLMGLDL
jgi:hypothetical protein